MTAANDKQVGGDHYRTKTIQPWDFIVANGLPFLEGNVVKYVCRWSEKGGLADLEKARHYLDKLIEINTTAEPASPFPKIDDFALRGYDESDMRAGGTD